MKTEEIVSDLNSLIALCKDGEQGFRTVAAAIEGTDYHSLFEEYAEQRHRFATDLQAEVDRLGGIPGKEGDLAGSLHRTWINLKATLAGRDPAAILAEIDAGEKAAAYAYQEVVEKELPPEIHALVEQQFLAVNAARARIQALESQLA